jgi:nicotinate-nucleotide adenylyltransferase
LSRDSKPLGLLGGTFDPIHDGHLAIAAAVRVALDLDEVVFIPAGSPPHKPGQAISPAGDRRAMIELAIRGEPAFRLSTIELDRPGPSYAVDTLAELARPGTDGKPATPLEFILSSEAFAGFPSWREPARILELARLAVVPRAGAGSLDPEWLDGHLPGWRSRVDFVAGPEVFISASTIRDRVRSGRSISGLVPPAVATYIHDHRLYTDPS